MTQYFVIGLSDCFVPTTKPGGTAYGGLTLTAPAAAKLQQAETDRDWDMEYNSY